METDQEKHAAAMQNNSLTTPAALSALERLPTEVLLMIGSELYELNFVVVTLVSKRLRSVFLPQRFKTLKFSGSLKKLARDMTSFLSGDLKHLMVAILPTLKSVNIRFEPYSHAKESTDLHHSTHRIAVIGEFISKLSSTNLISFHNQIIKSDIDFAAGLANTPKWLGPKAVIFHGRRNLAIFTALINQFAPNTVKAVHLPSKTAKNHPLALKAAFPSLKGLNADVTALNSPSKALACMNSSIVQKIDHFFPDLESLILDQRDLGPLNDKKQHLPNLNQYVEELVIQLKSMPRLRRFAFNFDRE